jgi:hypothetical protein
MVRQVTGIPASDNPMDPNVVAANLRVSPHWNDADYAMYQKDLGERTPLVLYSAMFVNPIAGTEADVAKHFGDSQSRARAMTLFVAMKDNLVVPVSACQPPPEEEEEEPAVIVLPERQARAGSAMSDPIGEMIAALGLPTMTDHKLLAALLLTNYLPNKAVGVRTYLESRLHLRDFHEPLLAAWFEAHPTLDANTWEAVSSELGGLPDFPAELHAWLPFDVPFRQSVALAMTQANSEELVGAVFPAMGRNMSHRLFDARVQIHSAFPDLGAWLAQVACS